VSKQVKDLTKMAEKFNKKQIKRIQDESSKTRLSILFYGLMENAVQISEQTLILLKVFKSFKLKKKYSKKKK
jgi:hypothetical protein